MTRSLRRALIPAVAFLLALPLMAGILPPSAQALPTSAQASPAGSPATPAFRVLVFSKTTGYRHDSIPDGIAAIQKLGQDNNFAVDTTEDATVFTDANLAKYKTVVFLSTTGDPLDQQSEKDAYQRYIEHGGGFVGIHAAADSGYNWAWYGNLVGAYFKEHPAIQQATVTVEDPAHPSTKGLPTQWSRTDEWYDYRTNPRAQVHVLTSLNEKSYSGGTMGFDHPNTWCQNYDGGHAWYTGLGHTKESYTEANFLHLVLGGIETTAGAEPADCSATQSSSFQKVPLDTSTTNPMQMQVAPDGRVFYVDLLGAVNVILPKTNKVITAANLKPFTANESGLLGIALDPNFETNHWVYVYYSPLSKSVDQISRFTLTSANTFDMSSEKVVLELPVQRQTCCHHGGSMLFDKDGNLWLAAGGNTNPFGSPTDAYAPLDFRPGFQTQDAARTAGNTNSLSGKVLRIHPQPDGSYTIPSGNLFAPGTAKTKAEIYAMGFRNPFRLGTDPKTGLVVVGDYGPDAQTDDPKRGPKNAVEFDILNKPGNYGWPFCLANNEPYVHYDYATGVSGAPYDCVNGPVNDSPNNTGLSQLPKPIPANVFYHYNAQEPWLAMGGGGAPMAGPVYRYNPNLTSDTKWPAYYDGKEIFGEWNQGKLYTYQLSDDQSSVLKINPLLPDLGIRKPMDMKFGPDGSLYVIDWGSGFGGNNSDSGIYRIDYVQGNRPPTAAVAADPTNGPAPLKVNFSSAGSVDPNGGNLTYAWDFTSDGTVDSTQPNPTFTYTAAGNFTASLTVTNTAGKTATLTQDITVGNSMPTIKIDAPPAGGAFQWGDQIPFKVTVTDPEDGTIDCSQVIVQGSMGHDSHAHALEQFHACSGTMQTSITTGHGPYSNLFWVMDVRYTDKGGAGGSKPLTADKTIIFQPQEKQAEYYSAASTGLSTASTTDPIGGNQDVVGINDGSNLTIDPVNLAGIKSLTFRVASSAGGTIEAHYDSATGPLVATAPVPAGNGAWSYVSAPVTDPGGSHPLFLSFKGASPGATNLFRLNWLHFDGVGLASNNSPPFVEVGATPLTGDAPLPVTFTAKGIDPEGKAVTYKWDFGDGGTSTQQNPSHTFATAAPWTATVTVTDADGATATASISGKATFQPTQCLGKASDEFNGTALDATRWSVVRQDQNLKMANGSLVIPTSDSDIYGTAANNTPNIVLQPAPSGPWQATTKLTLPANRGFQQAGLVLYGDDNNYAKMVYEARDTTGADAAKNVFQFIREDAGQPNEVPASVTAPLGAGYPNTVYVRLTSDGTNITASYSSDGTTFTAMPQTKALAGIINPRIGLIALAGSGTTPVVDAHFDWFHLTPDPTATKPDVNDEFNGATLDGCRWNAIVRQDPSAYRLAGGQLQIDTSKGDIYGTPNTDPKNFILQKAPAGDWTIETKVDGSAFNQAFQQGGLIAYGDDDNYVKLDYITDNAPGSAVTRRVEFRSEVGGKVQTVQPVIDKLTQGVWYLRLTKQGDAYHGYYSADGTTWTEIGVNGTPTPVSNSALNANVAAGVFAFGVNQTQPAMAKFDYFHASWAAAGPDTTAPTTRLSTVPAQPAANGWYTGPVTAILTASDGAAGSGVAKTEYQLDAGAWTTYTDPVTINGDGSHTLSYRSVDKAGNVETAKNLTVKIDAIAPATTATADPAKPTGANNWYTSPITVSMAATDATSGVAKTEYQSDGGAWTAYTTPITVTGDGAHTVSYRSVDKAGNVESSKTLTFKIDATAPVVKVTGVTDGSLSGDSASIAVGYQVSDATSGVASTSALLDGKTIADRTSLALYTLDLGQHTLVVTGVDKAGNQAVATIRFYITTSWTDIRSLIGQFYAHQQLNWKVTQTLTKQIGKAEQAEGKGDYSTAIRDLRQFESMVGKQVSNTAIKTVLDRDAEAMIERLGGTPRPQATAANHGKSLHDAGRLAGDPKHVDPNRGGLTTGLAKAKH